MTRENARIEISKALKGMENQALANVVRGILFDEGNRINWTNAAKLLVQQMPEFREWADCFLDSDLIKDDNGLTVHDAAIEFVNQNPGCPYEARSLTEDYLNRV